MPVECRLLRITRHMATGWTRETVRDMSFSSASAEASAGGAERSSRHVTHRSAAAAEAVASNVGAAVAVDGVFCENEECQSPFPLAGTWFTRVIPTRGSVRLCAGCAAEVDRKRVCETCHEIYVAAKATPQSTSPLI